MDKYWVTSGSIYLFEGVSGPESTTILPQNPATSWQKYSNGSASRLAILLTNESSSWLGIVHGLRTIGVPFLLTKDVEQAVKHDVMLVYPAISGRLLSRDALRMLAEYARNGGVLVGINVLGGGLNKIFGFENVIASRKHTRIELQYMHDNANKHTFPGKTIRLANTNVPDTIIGTNSYSRPRHPPLGVYEDGSAAIVYNTFERGNVYAIGFDIGFYILKGYNRILEGVADTYANGYEPSIDVLLTLLKNIYREGNPHAVTLGTVPLNKSLSVMLTHDIDYSHSLVNALQYASHEQEQNTGGTHFIQTKYIRDWNDRIFFDKDNLPWLHKLQDTGVELASHSVSHSLDFAAFPPGDGNESYPSYRPFVKSRDASYNGTILGELRVSKFLLEHFLPYTTVVSFRPGYLANPIRLPQALQASGYRYSSSVTANVSMTHLPFRLNHGRDVQAEVDVYEFPITVEDELLPRMGDRLPQAIELAEKISRYGGIYVVLIHPDILGHKFRFQQELVKAVKEYAWFGSLAEFGDWWSARDKIELDVLINGDALRIDLSIPKVINGITLELPDNLEFVKSDANYPVKQQGNRLVMKTASGDVSLNFRLNNPDLEDE